MSQDARVFVVQDMRESMGIDFSNAESVGKVEYLLPGNRMAVLNTGYMMRKLREKLRGFTEDDYLLAAGAPAAMMAATVVAAKFARFNSGAEVVRILQWDREDKQYYIIEVPIL